ncbi:peptidoglycan-binding protein [Maricaulis sp.]|jgi:chemotaxis protein MotB|uniref:peptidoglycan-binding protein n=1 Tax=Maricaulis sp. TaxID=1486257 RepID=UPI0026071320|nr:peptidoglycan-binding protein [Maricaulis sp.]
MASPRFARFQEADSGDHWPGFVDALATLLLVIVFLLSIFVAGQFALSRALTSRDDQLADLNAQLAELANELNIARDENARLELRISGLEQERDALEGALAMATSQAESLEADLAAAEEMSEDSRRALALLNQQMQVLRDQLATLNEALDAAERRAEEAEAQVINLGERLNAALAERAAELAVYRSDFFGRLREILGNRTGVRIVGDRFVFETDVLFPSGSAALSSEGRESLRPIAAAIIQLTDEIPSDLEWVIRIDGHTDPVPIRTTYPSNWHLSAARAISVVNWFEELGVPSQRLVAAGFGEHHPIAEGRSEEANARNRRIELKLTSR